VIINNFQNYFFVLRFNKSDNSFKWILKYKCILGRKNIIAGFEGHIDEELKRLEDVRLDDYQIYIINLSFKGELIILFFI
jgi:hypothetical protein